jgi:hypothetical protein
MSSLLPDIVRPVLARHGLGDWPVHPDGFWCYVGLPAMRARIQGWKLHLSATPLAAPLVLAQAAEVLAQHRCVFKFASTTDNVRTLGSKQAARGAGGKFITVYCDGDDDQLRELAEDLHQATAGLPGPAILSDRPYRPGSLVHYRFGVMRGVQALTDDGRYEAMLVAPDGRLVPDERNAWYSPPKWAPRDPFARPDAKPRATSVRLNDRYVVTEAIRHAFTGGVFRARDEQTGALVIIKQARRHAGGTIGGQDRRDTRRHEAQMLRRFQDSGITPRLVDLFDQQGDLFLVQEAINGVTLRRWTPETLDAVERVARGLVDLMAAVHAEGLVLRDFTPGNVIIDESGTPKLIDLELLAVPGQQVIVGYTPGFAAPEQIVTAQISAAPDFSADLYSLGATLLLLATGANPPVPERWLDHVSVQNATARRLKAAIVPLLHKDPHQRPSLAEVRALLARSGEPKPLKSAVDIDGMAAAVVKHLIGTMRPDSGELWSLSHLGFRTDPLNVQFGAAGVVGVLTGIRLADPGLVPAQVIATAAQWIARKVNLEPRVLPGLYFGRTGTAWALLDAGTQLGDKELAGIATDLALRVPVEWPNPDVCHGIAGAGLGQLKFWAATGDPAFLARSERIAEALTKTVEREYGLVRWPIPERARNSRHGFRARRGGDRGVSARCRTGHQSRRFPEGGNRSRGVAGSRRARRRGRRLLGQWEEGRDRTAGSLVRRLVRRRDISAAYVAGDRRHAISRSRRQGRGRRAPVPVER